MSLKFKHNHFAGMAGTKEIVKSNGMKYTVRQNRVRIFFPDEWRTFIDAVSPKQRVTFKGLSLTGMRINEFRNVEVRDIDFDRNSIAIRWTKSRNEDGSRKMRVIPISTQYTKELKGIIREYNLKPEDKLPILSTPAANIAMKKALKGMGVEDYMMFSVHNLRKTLESWLLALDIDSMKVTKHFGHSVMVAAKFYISPDTFNYEDKKAIRDIIGDLYLPQRY